MDKNISITQKKELTLHLHKENKIPLINTELTFFVYFKMKYNLNERQVFLINYKSHKECKKTLNIVMSEICV
jgi:hypothetical protein